MTSDPVSLVVSAPSGAGKTTIITRVMKEDPRLVFSVSTTTRSLRDGEVEGKNYYYINDDEFKNMIGKDEFLEWAQVHTHYYGTSKKELDRIRAEGKIPVFDVDVQGAKNLRKCLPGAVLIFIIPPSFTVLSDRLVKRNTEDKNELTVRLQNAVREVRESALYDYIIVNDNLNRVCDDFRAIVQSEPLRAARMKFVVESILEDQR